MLSSVAKRALSWSQCSELAQSFAPPEQTNGPAHAQALLRTFGQPEKSVRVTLFRDNHAWCPYCQKVWLWLEEKKVPYRIRKVSMFCYGDKEQWYKRLVPSGMLPALELDGQLITQSDTILHELEMAFGPLGAPMERITSQRRLERQLFGAWCDWLCHPSHSAAEEGMGQAAFEEVLARMERELGKTPGPWMLGGNAPSTADVVFVPYGMSAALEQASLALPPMLTLTSRMQSSHRAVERMNASLYYYKGFEMRDPAARPNLCRWFAALEARDTYLGTQSDFHTHVHDLPPQMGGCYPNHTAQQQRNALRVDAGPWVGLADTQCDEPATARQEAAYRVVRHRESLLAANPCASPAVVDEALRCALTRLLTGEAATPPAGSDAALRYVRDRVNVPRDMSLWAGRRLREALEETAALAGSAQGPPIALEHRRDQDPRPFHMRKQQAGG